MYKTGFFFFFFSLSRSFLSLAWIEVDLQFSLTFQLLVLEFKYWRQTIQLFPIEKILLHWLWDCLQSSASVVRFSVHLTYAWRVFSLNNGLQTNSLSGKNERMNKRGRQSRMNEKDNATPMNTKEGENTTFSIDQLIIIIRFLQVYNKNAFLKKNGNCLIHHYLWD